MTVAETTAANMPAYKPAAPIVERVAEEEEEGAEQPMQRPAKGQLADHPK
jgi:hypothetical protein